MKTTTSNPSCLELLGLITIHTTVSTNARIFTVVIGPRTIGLFTVLN